MIKKGYFFLIFFPLSLIAADIDSFFMSSGSFQRVLNPGDEEGCANNLSDGIAVTCRENPLREEQYCYNKTPTHNGDVRLRFLGSFKCVRPFPKKEK